MLNFRIERGPLGASAIDGLDLTTSRRALVVVSAAVTVQRQTRQTMVYERAPNDAPQTLQIERARNPHDVHSIVGVQLIPLEHGPLKQVQSALHTPNGAASAGPNAVNSILIRHGSLCFSQAAAAELARRYHSDFLMASRERDDYD